MYHSEGNYLSLDEVRAKLSCLSKADLLRLGRIAELQAKKLRVCESEDLLAEGLKRVVSGDRRWPRGLGTSTFMKNVFASIVSSKAKHAAFAARYEVDAEVDQSGDVISDQEHVALEGRIDPTMEIYAQRMLGRMATTISDDPDALALAMALGEGLTASETQTQFHMSQKQYDSARKRLRRVVNRMMTEENAS